MNREPQQSWWRELGAISRGLDFLQGGGFDPSANATTQTLAPARATPARHRVARLLHTLGFLGGRPMHAGHNGDLDEPFATLPRFGRNPEACGQC